MSIRKTLTEEVAAALNNQICTEASARLLYFSIA